MEIFDYINTTPPPPPGTVAHDTARFEMWCRILGDEYRYGNKNKKKHLKEKFEIRTGVAPHNVGYATTPCGHMGEKNNMSGFTLQALQPLVAWQGTAVINTIADCSAKCAPAVTDLSCYEQHRANQEQPKGNTMYNDTNPERSYLTYRLDDLHCQKDAELTNHFHLYPMTPETIEEALERFAAGAYTIKKDKDRAYHSWTSQFSWEDPKNPADRKGYDEASKKLTKAVADTRDTIKVLDAASGLAALKAFEATETTTFH